MKKVYMFTGIALALTLLIAVGWSQATALAENQQLPYKASGPEYVLQEAPHPDCGPDRIKVDVQGSGQGTYVGQYTIVRQHCFNPATATIEDGYFEQTAANGDKIFGTYSGFVEDVLEVDENGNPVVIAINSPWTIIGGTGRFTEAKGKGDTSAVFNLVTKEGDFDMEGWISYSASE